MLALLIWTLAAYGFVVGLCKLVRYVYARSSFDRSLTLVLMVCNAEGYVEGIIRLIAYKSFMSRKELRLVVVDTGSQDATCEIVRRMQEKDGRIELIETKNQFDTQIVAEVWSDTGPENPFILFDLRGWRNPRKVVPGLVSIVE
ncbi:glycosyltransferase [Effusibacillus pohliae]|uniref:glycosyltransferase n=1 Tax=Effusibacillus pohliae TaxID=232270 RepID=UPI000365102A|nr:glycosyltransferase [Effusibacillus pohliae]